MLVSPVRMKMPRLRKGEVPRVQVALQVAVQVVAVVLVVPVVAALPVGILARQPARPAAETVQQMGPRYSSTLVEAMVQEGGQLEPLDSTKSLQVGVNTLHQTCVSRRTPSLTLGIQVGQLLKFWIGKAWLISRS